MDFIARSSDGSGPTTTNSKDGVGMNAPAHHHRQLLCNGTPEMLWSAHQQKVAEL